MKKLIFGLLLGVVGFVVSGCGAPLKTIQITDLKEELKTVEPMAIHRIDTAQEQFALTLDKTAKDRMAWPHMALVVSRNCTKSSYNPTRPILSLLIGFPIDMMAHGSGVASQGILSGTVTCEKDSPILTTIDITTQKAYGAFPDRRIRVECVSPQNQLLTTEECLAVTEAALLQWNPKAYRIQLAPGSRVELPYNIVIEPGGTKKLVPNIPTTK